jgi:plastocyanin
MVKHRCTQTQRSASLLVVACLMLIVFALAACGGDTMASTTASNNTSSNSNSPAPAATVNIKETKGAAGKDVYSCDPQTISIKVGDTVSFTNQSDEIQDFDQGDAQKAGVDFKMNLNQSTTATFKTAGTFTIKSEKGATITVTVQ